MTTDISKFQIELSRRLMFWAVVSSVTGLVLILWFESFWKGFGVQALVWGGIDGVIAALGLWFSRKRRKSISSNVDLSAPSRLKRTLLINAGLDLVYIAGGVLLISIWGRLDLAWLGHGWGIIVQAVFLFFFDLINAQCVPPGDFAPLKGVFADPKHKPFFRAGGPDAALLVHGFPGTPAEMLPLADLLNQQGWTVKGILLPGFGPQFAEIFEYGQTDWLDRVKQAFLSLKDEYDRVLLVGYSLGGALCLQAAADIEPDGLVLISPFFRLGNTVQQLIGLILRPFLPRYFRPLKTMDFNDPNLRHALQEFFQNKDINDPKTREELRSLQVPLAVVIQLIKAGRQGFLHARQVKVPTLVIQGTEDELVRPENTRRIVDRLRGKPRYLEVSGGHNSLDNHGAGWSSLETELLEFIRSIQRS